MELLEKYQCKFCPEMILSGFRCLECYIKKAGEKPKKKDNPFIQATRRDLYVPTDIGSTTAGSFRIGTSSSTDSTAFNAFTYDGGVSASQPTFTTSNSSTLGFRAGAYAQDLED